MKKRILIIDDEVKMRSTVREILEGEDYDVEEADDGLQGLELLRQRNFNVVILDINLPKRDGLEILVDIKKFLPQLPVIMFTAFGSNDRIIRAMKSGAYDYIDKPFDLDHFIFVINRAAEYASLLNEVSALRSNNTAPPVERTYDEIVAVSDKMKSILKLIGRAAPTDVTVLIEGESGSGKEIIADTIRKYSLRSNEPYVKINCAALPETLLESELFGYEKGAFTDAGAKKPGRFELADKGTVFLDEINDMSPALQTKLLRFLQHRTFERVGGKETLSVDVRIIAATNKHIEEEVQKGGFREDLFYRLNIIHIKIPPLREHPEDIPPLVEHFIRKYNAEKEIAVSDEAMEMMFSYSWPGNIREVENMIRRALILAEGNLISGNHLSMPEPIDDRLPASYETSDTDFNLRTIVSDIERQTILRALDACNWNRTKAAELLGINRRLLFSKIRLYNIEDK